MKRNLLVFILLLVYTNPLFAQTNFSNAIKTCQNYSQTGSIPYSGQMFDILITLQKTKDKCVYKEKIISDNKYELLTCNFNNGQLPFLSDMMSSYNDNYKKYFKGNKIFEAKMTSNYDIFQKYLSNPDLCSITYSKPKTKKK